MGDPWRHHHNQGGSFSSSSFYYPSSSSYYGPPGKHDNSRDTKTYSTNIPPGPLSSHFDRWHHSPSTSVSHRSWPSKASDNRSAATTTPPHTPTPLPIPPNSSHGLAEGALAAAVVVPILTLFAVAIALVFCCLRRRRTQSREGEPQMSGAPPGVIKAKLGSFRRRSKPPPPPHTAMAAATSDLPPIVTSHQNNAYYTGLDTSSLGSRGDSGEYQLRASYEAPPPPYVHEAPPPPAPLEYSGIGTETRGRSPFDDPEDYQDIADGMLFVRSDTPRSRSNHSATSTLYSDNASVHDAKEARRSIGGAHVIERLSMASEEGTRVGSDPFVSPLDSPTSPASRTGFSDRDGHRRASDVSEMDRP